MINEDYVYLAEKLREARRALMLPHPKDETEGMICRAGEGAASATPAGERGRTRRQAVTQAAQAQPGRCSHMCCGSDRASRIGSSSPVLLENQVTRPPRR